MSVIGWITLFLSQNVLYIDYDIVYMHAMPCHTFLDIKPYTTVHRFDIPYHQKYFVVPLFIWAVINCVPKPVPGRNNKHQESDIVTVL